MASLVAAFAIFLIQKSPKTPTNGTNNPPVTLTGRAASSQAGTNAGRELARKLADLNASEITHEKLRIFLSDEKNRRLLAAIDVSDFGGILEKCGINNSKEDSEYFYWIWSEFLSERSRIDPVGIIKWLEESNDKQMVICGVVPLSLVEPERLKDLILKTFDCSSTTARSSEGGRQLEQLFSQLGNKDPARAMNMIVGLENESLKKRSIRSMLSAIQVDTFPPENWPSLVEAMPESEIIKFSKDVGILGVHLQSRAVDEVLRMFPIDEINWKRDVSIEYIKTKAVLNPAAIIEYLDSNASSKLSQSDRVFISLLVKPAN